DKFDRLGDTGVRALLGEGRKDESGDFTKGAGLGTPAIDRVISSTSPQTGTNEEVITRLTGANDNAVSCEGVGELSQIAELVKASGYSDRIRIDPSVVAALEYYKGPAYKVEWLLETKDEKGRPVRFGSVGGGGRYDGLVSRFRGEP